jgi:hypothetical protein
MASESIIVWIVAFAALGGVLGVLATAMFLLLPESLCVRLLPWLVSFAIGALLGAAFLALIPRALESRGRGGGARDRAYRAARAVRVLRAREDGAMAPLPHPRFAKPMVPTSSTPARRRPASSS